MEQRWKNRWKNINKRRKTKNRETRKNSREQHRFEFFFKKNEQWVKQCRFVQNMSFHWKEKGVKKCQFSNRSLIFDLFNPVLNWDFDFKNQFNCILAKFKCQPWSWPAFFLWFLVLNLCILIINWSTNF
jgi:hypothetical protein